MGQPQLIATVKRTVCEAEMSAEEKNPCDRSMTNTFSIAFVLLGVGALVLKRHYSGPLREVIWEYGGNVAASFAVYFLMTVLPFTARSRRLLAAGLALLVVEVFEAIDGFGVMSNVYDRIDFVANVVGVGLALVVDTAARRICSKRSDGSESSASGRGDGLAV